MKLRYLVLPLTVLLFHAFPFALSMEVDATRYVAWVVDGDTFNTSFGDVVRLADIDAPDSGEPGYHEATDYLVSLIKNKTVYIDIDDVNMTDSYGRLVGVVYLDFNATHYMNVNEALLIQNLATVWDHPNEFDPRAWTLFTAKAKDEGVLNYVWVTIAASAIIIFLSAIAIFKGSSSHRRAHVSSPSDPRLRAQSKRKTALLSGHCIGMRSNH